MHKEGDWREGLKWWEGGEDGKECEDPLEELGADLEYQKHQVCYVQGADGQSHNSSRCHNCSKLQSMNI